MHKLTIVVPVSTDHQELETKCVVQVPSKALMPKIHLSLSFVLAPHESQHASNSWVYLLRLVLTTSSRRMLGVCSSPISRPKPVATFAGLGLSPQIALVCFPLPHAGLVAEPEVSPLNSQMVFSLLAPSHCELMYSPMVFPICHISIVSMSCENPTWYSAERSVTLHSFDFTKYRLWTSLFRRGTIVNGQIVVCSFDLTEYHLWKIYFWMFFDAL